ncbi:MAG: hypothetical protein JKX79_13025 [Labilibaculum sp.]|nr:hypothetical protein [Labilibaculum sp.]
MKEYIVRFINKLSRIVQQSQKLNFMGVDEQFESLVQLRNTSKPIKSACFFSSLIGQLFEIAHETKQDRYMQL